MAETIQCLPSTLEAMGREKDREGFMYYDQMGFIPAMQSM
jgi:hypothetical protein